MSKLFNYARSVFAGLRRDAPQTDIPSLFGPDTGVSWGLDGHAAVFQDATVMITGAGGFIGSALADRLLSLGPRKLILLEMTELSLITLERKIAPRAEAIGVEIVPILGSVCDAALIRRVLRAHPTDIILHAAAYKHLSLVEANPLPGLANNVFGTQTLARAAMQAGVKRFVFVSSDKAVRPASVMGASKRLAEMLLRDLALRHGEMTICVVRFGNVIGSSGSVLPLFEEQIAKGGPVTVTDPHVERYFMTTSDAVGLVLNGCAMASGGEVFVPDMGRPVSIHALARRIIGLAATAPGSRRIEITFTGLRPGEKLREELTSAAALQPTPRAGIFRAQEPILSQIEIAGLLRDLQNALEAGDEVEARRVAFSAPPTDWPDLGVATS